MKKRIIVPVKPNVVRIVVMEKDENGVRAALVENGEASEFMVSVNGRESVVGNIYVGKVETVTRSGFAFIDIGMGKNAFLNLNDHKNAPNAALVKQGGLAAVMVTRDAVRDKGACVTTRLSWPGRFYVLENAGGEAADISVSAKITAQRERDRLTDVTRKLVESLGLVDKHIILRTHAQNAAPSGLESELAELAAAAARAEGIIAGFINAPETYQGPLTVHSAYASPCAMMAAELMAVVSYSVKEIVVNDAAEREVLRAAYEPKGIDVIFREGGLFAAYNLEKTLESTKHRMVQLPSGGYIVIERTEACVVVDVNSGQYAGRKSLEDMAFKINTEAAWETAKQLRLRNLSGVIIVDFIGMKEPAHVSALTDEFKKALAGDSAATVVEGMTRLGLMEMTRKRTRNPLWG